MKINCQRSCLYLLPKFNKLFYCQSEIWKIKKIIWHLSVDPYKWHLPKPLWLIPRLGSHHLFNSMVRIIYPEGFMTELLFFYVFSQCKFKVWTVFYQWEYWLCKFKEWEVFQLYNLLPNVNLKFRGIQPFLVIVDSSYDMCVWIYMFLI